MKVDVVQMNVVHCQKEHNLERALDYVAHCQGEIIVFPEVFTTGFCYDRIDELAESDPYPTIEMLQQTSKDTSSIIVGSIIVKEPSGKFYNMGFVLDNGYLTGTYHKVHPFGIEKEYFLGGDIISPITTSRGLIGLMICYDIRFPEVARKLTLEGADILITVAQFPSIRQNHWDILARARAIENQIPHVACNCIGHDPSNEFKGGSVIIDGWGRVLGMGDSTEGIVTALINLQEKEYIRQNIPCFSDRREELYSTH